MSKQRRLQTIATALAVAGASMLAACADDEGDGSGGESPAITDAWARVTAPSQSTGAVYMKIESDQGDELIEAEVPSSIAAEAELHESVSSSGSEAGGEMSPEDGMDGMDAGSEDSGHSGDDQDHADGAAEGEEMSSGAMMGMRPVDGIPVEAGTPTMLEPGGYHVMLLGLKKPIIAGQEFPLTLTFSEAGEVEVTATAREG